MFKLFKGIKGVIVLDVFDVFSWLKMFYSRPVVLYTVFMFFPPQNPGQNPSEKSGQKPRQTKKLGGLVGPFKRELGKFVLEMSSGNLIETYAKNKWKTLKRHVFCQIFG